MLNLAEVSTKSGINWTSTEFSPSFVIFHNASTVFPTFEKPMFRKGSNWSLGTWGITLIGISNSAWSVSNTILSVRGLFYLLSYTMVSLSSRPEANGPSFDRWTDRKDEAGFFILILRLFWVTFLTCMLIS